MKTVKISLILIVVTTITFFVVRSITTPDEVGVVVKPSENPFIDTIQQAIKTLKHKPQNMFCKDYYMEVDYRINELHKDGRLGKGKNENDQWKDNLSKQLYAAYADKFISQAYYVFNRPDWPDTDLNFIRREYRALQNSPFLEKNSPIYNKFNELEKIFVKYDEIKSFISTCKGFQPSGTNLEFQYPLEDVKNKINTANRYRNNRLENSYVNNCIRLHNELEEIPQIMFQAHVRYLEKEISRSSGYYVDFNSQADYKNYLYSIVESKINELDNDIYNVSYFSSEYSRLIIKWQADGDSAYEHFNKK